MFGTKFRPLTFSDVLGLDPIKKILRKYIELNSFSNGYLFTGSHSSGKTSMSRIFSRAILCSNRLEDMSPCNECPSCLAFLEDRNPGYLEIDAANNGTKDRIKDIKESLKYESIVGKKIILFDEAHNISTEGKDALLAQLELDKNGNIILIFCTTEPEKIPSTIRSRCTEFSFIKPSEKLVLDKLRKICDLEEIEYEEEALDLIVRASGRHYRDAENKLEQALMLGSIDKENVSTIVSVYDDVIVDMLINLPADIGKSLDCSEYLLSRMNVKDVYNSILRIVNDTIKYMNGIQFSSHYSSLLSLLKNQYNSSLFDLLDYIINKDKLNDAILFQSDILMIHYKFLKGGIKSKAFKVPDSVPKQEIDSREGDSVHKKSLKEISSNELEPWEREDLLRQHKLNETKKYKSEKVKERVSDVWGPETKDKLPPESTNNKLSRKEFCEALGDDFEETI